ncbi:major facilitator superfamily domain-containing protein [Microdochium bolleyi]|uniref:Major facilitator superfamily domain-containing protein n=1 Tax=Microdochium bolleyi TaxID=196109 RepID=A0A136J0R8_9PEZI|nr:major facilitator superfamily domain-containing protein [Microdochium bolleyi]
MASTHDHQDVLERDADDISDAGEDVAFLPSHSPRADPVQGRRPPRQHRLWPALLSWQRLGNGIVTDPTGISAIMCLAVFLWVMSGMIAMVPAMQLVEELFCQRYYVGTHPDIRFGDDDYEKVCKAEAVQSAMAYVGGITSVIDSIIGLLLAFPFGVLADRARRPIYLLGAAGQLLNVSWALAIFYFSNIFPVELILLGPVFQLLGGGLPTAVAILFAVISDVHNPESRARWYFFFSLSAQAAVFIGPPFASALMGHFTAWTPLMTAPFFTAAAGLVILLVPETARPKAARTAKRHPQAGNSEEAGGLLRGSTTEAHGLNYLHEDEGDTTDANDDIWQQIQSKGWLRTIKSHLSSQLREARGILRDLAGQRSVVLLFAAFAITAPLGKGFGQTFVQYVSKRYHKTIEEVGYLFALRGGLTLVIMGLLLPLLSHMLTSPRFLPARLRPSPFRRDLVLAQMSALFSLLGFFGLSTPSYGVLVGSLAVESLGSGLLPLCRSMVTNFCPAERTTSLFSLISMVETVGGLPAGLLLAWLFSMGMKLGGGWWYGLPFLYLAVCAAVGLVVLLFVQPPEKTFAPLPSAEEEQEEEGEGDGDVDSGEHGYARRDEEQGAGRAVFRGDNRSNDDDESNTPPPPPSTSSPLLMSASSSLPATTLPVRQG